MRPAGKDPKRDVRALTELEPIGTEVASFDAVARFGRRSADLLAAQSRRSITFRDGGRLVDRRLRPSRLD